LLTNLSQCLLETLLVNYCFLPPGQHANYLHEYFYSKHSEQSNWKILYLIDNTHNNRQQNKETQSSPSSCSIWQSYDSRGTKCLQNISKYNIAFCTILTPPKSEIPDIKYILCWKLAPYDEQKLKIDDGPRATRWLVAQIAASSGWSCGTPCFKSIESYP
jgi:hypothetical protein